MWAACRGHIRVVHALMEGGADAKKQCSDGSRAVDLASLNGLCQVKTLEMLFIEVATDVVAIVKKIKFFTAATCLDSNTSPTYKEHFFLFYMLLMLPIYINTVNISWINSPNI